MQLHYNGSVVDEETQLLLDTRMQINLIKSNCGYLYLPKSFQLSLARKGAYF